MARRLTEKRLTEIERAAAREAARDPDHPAFREHIPALLAEVRRLRAALGTLLALAPEDDHYVSEAGCESWASDEYEAAQREARAALDGTA